MQSSSPHQSADEQSRRHPLGPAEDLLVRMQDAFDGDGMGAILVRVRGIVEEAPMRVALARLQLRHPRLHGRIVTGGDGRRCFEVLEKVNPIPLEFIDADADSTNWQDAMLRIASIKMDIAAGPLARVAIWRSRKRNTSDVIFSSHHAVSDGLSAYRIMDDILSFYAEAEAGGELPPVATLPYQPTARVKMTGSLMQRLRLIARVAKSRRSKRRGDWTALPSTGAGPKRFTERHVMAEDETTALVKRCRDEGTSVTGAHFAAAICGLCDVLPPPGLRVKCRLPVSIRQLIISPHGAVTDQDVGCFISGFEWSRAIDRAPEFWALARQVRDEMKEYVAAGGPQILYGLVRFARLASFKTAPRRDTLAVNCAGIAPIRERYGSLVPEECSITGKNDRLGAALNITSATIGRRLCITFGSVDVDAAFAARFYDAFLRHLHAAARPRPT